MKQILFNNWHMMRWFRLAFALFLFSQAYTSQEWFFVIFGFFFLFQVVFNLGCGPKDCALPTSKKHQDEH